MRVPCDACVAAAPGAEGTDLAVGKVKRRCLSIRASETNTCKGSIPFAAYRKYKIIIVGAGVR